MELKFNYKNLLSSERFLSLSIYEKLLHFVLLYIFIEMLILIYKLLNFIKKYFLYEELNLIERYGKGSWGIITGPSSGQGKQFSLEFAKRGFNLILIGSERTYKTEKLIKQLYPNVKTIVLVNAMDDDFFDDIEEVVKNNDVSLLVNNVAHRIGWIPYHEMEAKMIKNTITVGTIVQSRLIHLIIPKFLKRQNKSGMINITAQCMHPNFGFGVGLSNEISVPYLSVYEAANSFGFYHSNSIYKEYKNDFDILNITPGAVVTENTEFLNSTLFNVSTKDFVRNCLKLLGNFQGSNTCGYWGHSFTNVLINIVPFCKDYILENVGKTIAIDYMNKDKYKKY